MKNSLKLEKLFTKSKGNGQFLKQATYLVEKHIVGRDGLPLKGDVFHAEVSYLARALHIGVNLGKPKHIVQGILIGFGTNELINGLRKRNESKNEEA